MSRPRDARRIMIAPLQPFDLGGDSKNRVGAGTQKLVALAVYFYPESMSYARLAKLTGLGRKTCQNAIVALHEKGLIDVQQVAGGPNTYEVLIDRFPEGDP